MPRLQVPIGCRVSRSRLLTAVSERPSSRERMRLVIVIVEHNATDVGSGLH